MTIHAKSRKSFEKVDSSFVPATVYGPEFESLSISVERDLFTKNLKSLQELKIQELDLEGKIEKVLVKNIQQHPISRQVQNIEFYRINPKFKVNVEVPLHFTGTSMAVKNNIGFLVTPVSKVAIRCLAESLPEAITVDISNLDQIGMSILVKDLSFNDGVEIDSSVDIYSSVATIVPPQKIVEEKTVAATDTTTETAPIADTTTTKAADTAEK